MNDTRASIVASTALAIVTVIAIVLIVEAPAYVTQRSIETFEAEQRIIATNIAGRISADLSSVQKRLELPMVVDRPWSEDPTATQMRGWLSSAAHPSDTSSGIALFAHDRDGNILAVSPDASPDAPGFTAHNHQLDTDGDYAFGVCQTCLTKLGALSLEVSVGDGVFVGANIDAEDLAREVFESVLDSPNIFAALLDDSGNALFELGARTSASTKTVSARVPVANTPWTVAVTAPTASVADELRAGSRWFVWLGGGLLISVIAALIGLVAWTRRRERRRVERQRAMAHQDKLATVGTLASSVAHEIGNTITIAKSNLYFLSESTSADSLDAVDDAVEAVERLEGLAGDLSKFVSGGSDEREELSLEDVVESAQRIVEPKFKHDATIRAQTDSVCVLGRRRALVQVVVNLLLNAYDASPESTRCEIDITVETRDGRALLIVEDNGEGIPEPMLERIFEAFVTTKNSDSLGGTGLGLWLSSRIVSEHDGRMRAENRDQGGARFIVDLPVADTET